MAESLGSLVVSLGLDAGTYTTGLTKADRDAKAFADNLKASTATVLKFGAGLAGLGSIAAFASIITDSIEAKAALARLSDQTGASVEALSALGKIGKLTNTGIDDIAAATNKLNKALVTQNEDSKGAAQAIAALGLNFATLKAAAPDEQMLQIAKAFNTFEDGTGKGAAAMLLFGKQGASLLPFLKDLGEQTTLVGKQTTESARAAEEYEKNLIRLRSAGEDWKRSLAESVLPTLLDFTNQLLDGKKAFGGFTAALFGIGLGTNPFKDTGENLRTVRQQIDDVTVSLNKAKANGGVNQLFTGAGEFTTGLADTEISGLTAQLDQLQKLKSYLISQQSRDALGGTSGAVLDRFDRKPRLVIPDALKRSTAATPRDDFTALFKQATGLDAVAQAALDSETKLTEAQQLGAKIAADYSAGLIVLSDAQLATLDATLKSASAAQSEAKARELEVKWAREATEANAQYIEGQQKYRDTLQDQSKSAAQQLAEFGLAREALDALEVARLRDTAAVLQAKAAQADSAYLEDIAKLYREQAAAINETADAKAKLSVLKTTTADAKELNDVLKNDFGNAFAGFLDGSQTAAQAFRSFANSVVADIARIEARKLAEAAFGEGGGVFGGAGSTGGFLGSLLGYFSGSGGSANAAGGFATAAGISGGRAGGGGVMAGKTYMVGEQGPELFTPNMSGAIIPNKGSGDTHNHINVTVQGAPNQSRDSAMQQGAAIGLAIQRALSRNT